MQIKEKKDRSPTEITEAALVSKFFGFAPFLPPPIQKQDFDAVKNVGSENLEEKALLHRIYIEEKMGSSMQPVMLYCERPFPGSRDSSKRKGIQYLYSSL